MADYNPMEKRFQGVCLISSQGRFHMHNYDDFPEPIRNRLQHSPFNICAACVSDEAHRYRFTPDEGIMAYSLVIEAMERKILQELGPFGPQQSELANG